MRRTTVLAVGFLIACIALSILLFLQRSGPSIETFGDCRAHGYAVTEGWNPSCTASEHVYHANDRVVFSSPAVQFSFSYPGTAVREPAKFPLMLSVNDSGATLTLRLVSGTEKPEQILRSIPGFETGSLTILRSSPDGRNEVVVGLQPPKSAIDRSIAVFPLHPPVSSFGHLYDDAVLWGSGKLVSGAIDSLAFDIQPIKAPKSFFPLGR